MKKYSFYSLIVMLIMTMFVSSCTAESELDKEPEESARYYVKYEVTFITQHINAEKYFTVMTDKGAEDFTFNKDQKTSTREGTYGPVDKDFVASIKCSVPD